MSRPPPRKEDWALRCPRDGTELVKVQVDSTTFDRCLRCSGLWFDAKELTGIVGDAELEKVLAPKHPERGPKSRFGCPRCAGDCHEITLGGVVTDACTHCHGVWLDGGELDTVRVEVSAVKSVPRKGLKAFLTRV